MANWSLRGIGIWSCIMASIIFFAIVFNLPLFFLDVSQWYYEKSLELYLFGPPSAALYYVEKSMAQEKTEQGQYLLTSIYMFMGDYESAKKDLETEYDFDDPVYHYFNGKIYRAEGDTKKAVDELEIAVALNDSFVEAFCHLGFAYFRSERYNESLVYLNKCVEQYPSILENANLFIFHQAMLQSYIALNDSDGIHKEQTIITNSPYKDMSRVFKLMLS
jgi:tetratricopeptide (TPR) repeat protein